VPIIGCPDYLSLMRERMAKIPIAFGPPAVPSSMISLIAARAPPSTSFTSADPNANPFIGKKVLVLSGRRDRLVPHEPHTRAFLQKLELGPDGLKEHEEYECGHELTPEMVARAAAFIARHGLGGERRAAL
jgi:predicted esterase